MNRVSSCRNLLSFVFLGLFLEAYCLSAQYYTARERIFQPISLKMWKRNAPAEPLCKSTAVLTGKNNRQPDRNFSGWRDIVFQS